MTDRAARLALELADEVGALDAFEVVLEIAAVAGASVFTTAEVVAQSRVRPRLRAAIGRACGELSGHKVGQLLARWEGASLGRMRIARRGKEGNLVLWAIETPEEFPGARTSREGVDTAAPINASRTP